MRAPEVARRRSGAALILAALLFSALAIALAAGFSRQPPPPPAEAKGMTVKEGTISLDPGAPQWKTLKLGAARAVTARWAERVPARVQLDQSLAARVGSPLAGRVTAVLVELGEKVRAGQPLFSVASPEIASLMSEREKARVELDAAKKTLDRVTAMVAARALPAKEEIAARQQYSEADLAYRLTGSRLASLHVDSKNDNEFSMLAPRSGVVVEKNVLASQEVQSDAANPLIVVADLSTVWVVADLFEADAAPVRQGAAAKVYVPYLPGEEFDCRVDLVSTVVDPVRHTVPIRLRLDNSRGRLRPNSYAEVGLSLETPPGAVEIAASALLSDGERQFVFVQGERGRFTKRAVVAGTVSAGRAMILSGLRTDEVVVEEGAILLDNQLALSN